MGTFSRIARSRWGAVPSVLVVLSLVVSAITTLVKGDLHYINYWGGRVFAPFALLILLLGIVGVVVSKIRKTLPPQKLRGRAARKARQAENTKFPIDEFRKW